MLYFIVNALSGKGKGMETAQKIKNILNEKKVEFQMIFTKAKAHAVSLAREFSNKEDCSGIVAVGGDGTFSEVLNGIDIRVPLGFVSSGSGNDFMRTFAKDRSLESQLQPIIENKTRKIDYIQIDDKRSLNVAGTGFDVDVLLNEQKTHKFLSGSLSYYTALIITLFTLKFRKFNLTVDDETKIDEECLLISMANGRFFGGGMPISPDSKLDDGVMDLVIVRKLPFYAVPGLLIKFMNGKLQEAKKYVDVYHCSKVEGAITPAFILNLDGELYDMAKFSAVLQKGGLTVFG